MALRFRKLSSALQCAIAALVSQHAAAETTYAIKEMPTAEGYEGSSVGVDPRGKIFENATDGHTSFGAFCIPQRCREIPRHQTNWHYLHPIHHSTVGEGRLDGVQWAVYHSYLGGRVEQIVPGIAWGVNHQQYVVGETADGQAFRRLVGTFVEFLPSLGGAQASARATNDRNFIVGYSSTADAFTRATLWQSGVPQDMGVLADGGQNSMALALNESNIAVGCADKQMQPRKVAVKFDVEGGTIAELGALGDNEACATAISPTGVIVGWSQVLPQPGTHAFVMEGSTMVDLNQRISKRNRAKYVLLTAGGVNQAGQIAVTALRLVDLKSVALRLDPQVGL